MAIPWLTVIKAVPWTEVITRAPAVVDGAKKLWSSVSKKPSGKIPAAEPRNVAAQPIPPLDARLAELENRVTELHQQMLAATELIGQLADQNARLVERVETNRARVVWLGAALAILAAALAFVFFYT